MNWFAPWAPGSSACFCAAVLLSQAGCAGWRVAPPTALSRLPARAEVQVWQHHRAAVFHGVQLRDDTLTGIAYDLPLRCTTCQMSIALADVDSVRLRAKPAERRVYFGIALGLAVAVGLVVGLAGVGP